MVKSTKTTILIDDDIVIYLKGKKIIESESYSRVLRRLLKLKTPK